MTMNSKKLFRLPIKSEFRPIINNVLVFNESVRVGTDDAVVLIDRFHLKRVKVEDYFIHYSLDEATKLGLKEDLEGMVGSAVSGAATGLHHRHCLSGASSSRAYVHVFERANTEFKTTGEVQGWIALAGARLFWISNYDCELLIPIEK